MEECVNFALGVFSHLDCLLLFGAFQVLIAQVSLTAVKDKNKPLED